MPGRIVVNETDEKQVIILDAESDGVSGGYYDNGNWNSLGESNVIYPGIYSGLVSLLNSSSTGAGVSTSYANNRRSLVDNTGVSPSVGYYYDGSSLEELPYNIAPVKIPSNASKLTVYSNPSFSSYLNVAKYENGVFSSVKTKSWSTDNDIEFEAGEDLYLFAYFRYNSSNATFTTDFTHWLMYAKVLFE